MNTKKPTTTTTTQQAAPTGAKPTNTQKYLTHQQILTDDQQKEIKKAFDYFDITGSGS